MSNKLVRLIITTLILMILFCNFTMSQYFLKIKLGETEESLSKITKRYEYGRYSIDKLASIYPINNSIMQAYDKYGNIIISESKFTSDLEYKYLTTDEVDKALESYKISVLHGNSIKGIIKVTGIKGDIMIVGEPLKDENENIIGTIFVLKFAREFNRVIFGLNTVLSVSMIFIFIAIVIPIYLVSKKEFSKMKSMTEMVMKMYEGDFSVRCDVDEDNKTELLSSALNDLAIRLENSEGQSKLLEQTRRDYVANVTHELKTPITSIRAMAEILKDGSLVDKIDKDKYYSMILRESVRMESLIKDMLELSRLQSGKASLEKARVNLKDTFLQVIDEFKIISEDLDIDLIIDIKFDELPYVYTNINRIAQVLVILLDNAFKYTADNGSVTLRVVKEEHFLKVSVCDTGIGVEDDDIPFIFDRFYKADKSHSSEGTGIGLSIAWEIMKNLDENIYYETTEKYKSIFNFTIHYE
ncbi:HAMP domain-containing sensor histidine kinase [Romboutsia sp. 1001713B170207_170306_H8]|nr:HAMP domain-containing sensor histidine kinase [Romboutsia sp. 1001713B170207_170306_H8]